MVSMSGDGESTNLTPLEKFTQNIPVRCSYCRSTKVNRRTMTCKDCGTTAPRNYGARQRKDKNGNLLKDVKK